jgi:CRISPR-associated protein Cmr4
LASKTFQTFGVLGLYTETPLHCGAEGGTGYVDLPIQRERHTQYPVIPGSTIKGVLRDELTLDEAARRKVFGEGEEETPTPAEGGEKAKKPGIPGSVSFGDGILVAFPVRSSGAPFHWVTCPFALERAFRLVAPSGVKLENVPKGQAWAKQGEGDVLLEEIRVTRKPRPEFFDGDDSGLAHLLKLLPSGDGFDYTRQIFPERLLVISDEDFKELVETGTEIVTRIKLNILGTTRNLEDADLEDLPEEERLKVTKKDREGNLFVEEILPPETLFLAPLRAEKVSDTLTEAFKKPVIRLGGDETIGRGVTHMTFVDLRGEG